MTGSSLVKLLLLGLRGDLRTIKDLNLYYFDASENILRLAHIFAWFFPISVEKLRFHYDGLVDDEGVNIGLSVLYENLQDVWISLVARKHFDGMFNSFDENDWFRGYVKKKLTIEPWPGSESRKSLKNILLMFKAAKLQALNNNSSHQTIFLIEKRSWMTELSNFAGDMDIKLVSFTGFFASLKQKILKNFHRVRRQILGKIILKSELTENHRFQKNSPLGFDREDPKIVVDQVMQFFGASSFWSASDLAPKTVLFVGNSHKIGAKEWDDILKSGMNFVSFSPHITKGLDVPIYQPHSQVFFKQLKNGSNKILSLEEKVVYKYVNEFIRRKNYWREFFKTVGAKVYVTLHKWSPEPVAAEAAIKEIGGLSALWQTSYYEEPVPYAAVHTDVYFSFSTKVASVEKKMGSLIRYNIAVGYTRDFMFVLLKDRAVKLRNKLKIKGCKKIISFFDMDSIDDERWGISHSTVRSEYKFWLNKVLEENWLGLIIKPKKPGTLRTRLGDVANLLDEAVKTGRCHIFLETCPSHQVRNFNDPPALSALASDVAIHSMLTAATAGLEAALTGTPTLLFDSFQWRKSQFYDLGIGKVVFNDWDTLWYRLTDHWEKETIPGFGDWTPILDDLDPFRDGKAAYRMTTYLHWIMQGFRQGKDRETIMVQASERYAAQWGADKVVCFS